jgi:GNAT superfamily N-acetyltransferase
MHYSQSSPLLNGMGMASSHIVHRTRAISIGVRRLLVSSFLSKIPRMIRPATIDDTSSICHLIRALGEYEQLSHEVVLNENEVRDHLFGPRPYAEVLLAVDAGVVVGFALFFHNFSTFLGKPGLYLEDLFVRPEHRGKGFGKALLQAVVRLAIERGCGRLEWMVLNWNEPAIEFYRSFGAVPLDQWSVYRLTGEALRAVGNADMDSG